MSTNNGAGYVSSSSEELTLKASFADASFDLEQWTDHTLSKQRSSDCTSKLGAELESAVKTMASSWLFTAFLARTPSIMSCLSNPATCVGDETRPASFRLPLSKPSNDS